MIVKNWMAAAVFAVCALAGETAQVQAEGAIAVKTVTAHFTDYSPYLVISGEVEARYQNDVAFRVTGRVSERYVDVGDHVTKGEVLARLEQKEKMAELESAKADVVSTTAVLTQAKLTLKRQKSLLDKGFSTRSDYDSAQEAYRVAQGNQKAAKANLSEAEQTLDDTVLRSEEDGVITARSVEVGQVVEAGGTIFSVARDGARDAVFKVHESLFATQPAAPDFSLSLISNPEVIALAHVREISPTIDSTTGTVRVKAAIDSPPQEMTLGAPIAGTAKFKPVHVAILPWSALMSKDGNPAVWVVDPATSKVHLQDVTLSRHETELLFVSDGLREGDEVVTAGVQYLFPGVQVIAENEGKD